MSAREESPERPDDPLCGRNGDLDGTEGKDRRDDTATEEDGLSLKRGDASGKVGTPFSMSGHDAEKKESGSDETKTHVLAFFFFAPELAQIDNS